MTEALVSPQEFLYNFHEFKKLYTGPQPIILSKYKTEVITYFYFKFSGILWKTRVMTEQESYYSSRFNTRIIPLSEMMR